VRLSIIAAVFPAIFIGELPDKTMFASLVMATRGRPFSVWLGAACAFLVHVVIAVSIGVGLFKLLPDRVMHVVVALLFAASAVAAFIAARHGDEREEELIVEHAASRVFVTAFIVIFLAEWGDLTQILTANLAVKYHSALSVGIGAALGLWAVSGVAVVGGRGVLAKLPTFQLRVATGLVLSGLAVWELVLGLR
jgi:putative Ca2+/H+ antiporter (TMEM165/GDT1 family)